MVWSWITSKSPQTNNPTIQNESSRSVSAPQQAITPKINEVSTTQSFISTLTTKSPHDESTSETNSTGQMIIEAPNPIQEYLLPTTMSCRDAFDSAFYCNSLGGAFTHLYRYGTVRSCSEHWNKFWFCMRTRTYGDEAKKKAIQEYYRNVEREKYGKRGTSSEDIWESRECLAEKGTAFKDRGEEWNGSDEEWRSAVLQMRKTMRDRAQNIS